jgi:sortase A
MQKPFRKGARLRHTNNVLAAATIAISLYTLLLPWLPSLWFFAQERAADTSSPEKQAQVVKEKTTNPKPGNWLYIPRLKLEEKINEGTDLRALNTGVWRRPNTARPNNGNNTVIVGHRFTYDGKSVFYNLDKVKSGDTIALRWEGKTYKYLVKETKVVSATAVEIEEETTEKQLTLYTCTPLWSAKDRLVIVSQPVDLGENE